VIARPPSNGAPNDTFTFPLPATTLGLDGADGTEEGTTAGDAGDTGPGPLTLLAETRHLYDLPFARPPTPMGEPEPLAVPGAPPFDDTHTTE